MSHSYNENHFRSHRISLPRNENLHQGLQVEADDGGQKEEEILDNVHSSALYPSLAQYLPSPSKEPHPHPELQRRAVLQVLMVLAGVSRQALPMCSNRSDIPLALKDASCQ